MRQPYRCELIRPCNLGDLVEDTEQRRLFSSLCLTSANAIRIEIVRKLGRWVAETVFISIATMRARLPGSPQGSHNAIGERPRLYARDGAVP
jgi:hypothetical protein